MKTDKLQEKGQTTLETALLIILLFIFFFGIAEIARAWYIKNALNNAARVGARVAVVESGITPETRNIPVTPPTDCSSMSGNEKVFCSIWNASGLPSYTNGQTNAILSYDGSLQSGTAVNVTVVTTFHSAVGGLAALSYGFMPDNKQLTAAITMRHE